MNANARAAVIAPGENCSSICSKVLPKAADKRDMWNVRRRT